MLKFDDLKNTTDEGATKAWRERQSFKEFVQRLAGGFAEYLECPKECLCYFPGGIAINHGEPKVDFGLRAYSFGLSLALGNDSEVTIRFFAFKDGDSYRLVCSDFNKEQGDRTRLGTFKPDDSDLVPLYEGIEAVIRKRLAIV